MADNEPPPTPPCTICGKTTHTDGWHNTNDPTKTDSDNG